MPGGRLAFIPDLSHRLAGETGGSRQEALPVFAAAFLPVSFGLDPVDGGMKGLDAGQERQGRGLDSIGSAEQCVASA